MTSTSYETYNNYRPSAWQGAPITAEQRMRAEQWLKNAYADGRCGTAEFGTRLEQVMTAQTRGQMDMAFAGLITQPSSPSLATSASLYTPAVLQRENRSRAGAVWAHLSVFVLWIFGPLLTYLFTARGSVTRREAAKAFNWQLTAFIGMIIAGIVGNLLPNHVSDVLSGIVMLVWFVLTLIGAVKASQGENWTNPVQRVVSWRPLREDS